MKLGRVLADDQVSSDPPRAERRGQRGPGGRPSAPSQSDEKKTAPVQVPHVEAKVENVF